MIFIRTDQGNAGTGAEELPDTAEVDHKVIADLHIPMLKIFRHTRRRIGIYHKEGLAAPA